MSREIAPLSPIAGFLALAVSACSSPALVESSATAVSVRYGGIGGIEEATQLAQRACAVHHKTARLRNTTSFGLTESYGHFDCT
jgi:hypothetical protein